MSQTLQDPARTSVAEPLDTAAHAGIRRAGGLAGILGAIVMISGAVLMLSAGSDWLAAATDRTFDTFLTDVTAHRTLMGVHLSLWIAGAVLMSLSSALIASGSALSAASVSARFAATAAAGTVMVAFPLVIGLIHGLAGHPEQALTATALGQAATVADDLATVMILAVAAPLAALAGRGTWAPRWLLRLAAVNAVIGALYFLPLEPIGEIAGVLLVLTGQAQMIAMGIVVARGHVSGSRR